MIDLSSIDNIYIAPGPTDLRKSIDGCAAIVQYQMFLDPFSKSIFIFCNRHKNIIKVPVLECQQCQVDNNSGISTLVAVSHRRKIYDRSMVSPELLAYIIDMKYGNGLPLYAIENMFAKQNIIIPRVNMCNWIVKSINYLQPLYDLMKEYTMSRKYLHADELCKALHNSSILRPFLYS